MERCKAQLSSGGEGTAGKLCGEFKRHNRAARRGEVSQGERDLAEGHGGSPLVLKIGEAQDNSVDGNGFHRIPEGERRRLGVPGHRNRLPQQGQGGELPVGKAGDDDAPPLHGDTFHAGPTLLQADGAPFESNFRNPDPILPAETKGQFIED